MFPKTLNHTEVYIKHRQTLLAAAISFFENAHPPRHSYYTLPHPLPPPPLPHLPTPLLINFLSKMRNEPTKNTDVSTRVNKYK